jgi:RNA polymerase sigma-70 factor (ECF subfamily)
MFDEDEHELHDEHPNPEECAMFNEGIAVLRDLISQIDATRRQVFIDHELLGQPLAEIAVAHGIPLKTAEKRLRLAWEELDQARARWQAAQQRRGLSTKPAFLFPTEMGALEPKSWWLRCLNGLRELGLRFPVHAGASAVVAAILLALVWAPLRAPRAAVATLVLTPQPRHDLAATATIGASTTTQGSDAFPVMGAAKSAPTAKLARAKPSPREDGLIDQARAALDAGDRAAARELLEAHGREFPRGRRASERDSLLRQIR